MVELLIKPCHSHGCCLVMDSTQSEKKKLSSNIKPSLFSSTKHVMQELSSTVYWFPQSLLRRLPSDLWSHFIKNEPRKPTWTLRTTVTMALLQTFRDHALSNSLAFWRLILIAPTFMLKPIKSRIETDRITIKQRNMLCGVLENLDRTPFNATAAAAATDATAPIISLEVEWMSAMNTVWETFVNIQQVAVASRERILLKDVESVATTSSSEKIVLYLHGGAYCAMSAQTHRTLTYKISKSTKRRVLAVNYRLAPETKFPGALYDVVQTFLYLIDPKEKYHFDPQNIVVMGDSAGGGLCLAMVLYLRDHGLPQPEGAVLLSPWVDLTFSYPSWKDASLYDYLPSNPAEQLIGMNPAQLYLDDPSLARHPYVSPIFAEHFDHLPPILIQSGGCESLRDEICDLTEKIRKSKNTMVHHEIYEDMVHVFQAFPFAKSSEAIESIGWWTKFGIPLITQFRARVEETISIM
ncbi:MAG: alpha/beta hydrolase fold-domain-containing protein [Benjaminiella poitrasii]|nr:MAG: alpha/beta hydrolase fold-domain-containing protein [Benjaminiella poitrasii]